MRESKRGVRSGCARQAGSAGGRKEEILAAVNAEEVVGDGDDEWEEQSVDTACGTASL